MQAVLALPDFRRLWLGQIFSQLADKFYIVLMVFLIAQYWVTDTPQNNMVLAEAAASLRLDLETRAQMITLLATGIYVANTVPAMVLGTVAGVWADRWPKRQVMVASNGLRAGLALLAPLALLPGPQLLGLSWGYWGLVAMTFLESVLTQFFAPAEQAAIPLLVPRPRMLAAMSLYQATSMGATIVGFALGDPVLRLLRSSLRGIGISGGEFVLLPLCYGLAALCISTIRMEEPERVERGTSVWNEIAEGIEVLRERVSVRRALLQLVLLYSILAALYVLAISLASAIEGLGPTRFGTLLAMSGVGMACGALGVAQLGQGLNRRRMASTGLALIAFSLVLLGQGRGSLWLTLGLCGLLGIGAALVAIPSQTTIQDDTPEAMRGKVFGLQNNLINVALSLPLVLAGAVVSRYGLMPVLWGLAAITMIAILIEKPWQRC
ncbi:MULTISPECIES: MFS transporter [unclassified Synechococcus]|uniref:MFS transporter n=1 Tax=Synechococcus sp. CCFWC 502 TaxID=2978474 RepID=UPI001E5110F8|nr:MULTISPECIES: MFS transporter [unclassified Synechococcus]WFN60571.1 MFS transporter [Synechococcus sp. CCFWC 502]